MSIRDALEQLAKIKIDEEERKHDFTIAFCGVFSSGKSSILNYFLDCKAFALPVGDFPITKVVTRIKYGRSLTFYCLIGSSGEKQEIDKQEFEQLVTGTQRLPGGCREIIIEGPSKILENNIVLVDTPGFLDEMGGELERLSREAVQKCDLAIFCTSAASLGHQFEREYIEELEESMGNYCMIVNRMDCCNTQEDEEDIYKKAAFLMKGKGGQYVSHLFGKNYFFTTAAGPRKTLRGFDSYLSYALGDIYLREQLKHSSAKKIAAFRKQTLAIKIGTEIDTLQEELDKTIALHKKKKSEIEQENKRIGLENEHERIRLTGVFEALLNEAAKNVENGIYKLTPNEIVSEFAKKTKEMIHKNYDPVGRRGDMVLGTGDDALLNLFKQEISRFEISEPQGNLIKNYRIFGLFAGRETYRILLRVNYQDPLVIRVKSVLHLFLLQTIKTKMKAYVCKETVPVQTGLEAHIDNMEQMMNSWKDILRWCKE